MLTTMRIIVYAITGLGSYVILSFLSINYASNTGSESSPGYIALIILGQVVLSGVLALVATRVRWFGLVSGLALVVGGISGRIVAGTGRVVEGSSPFDLSAMWQGGSLTMIAVALGTALVAVGLARGRPLAPTVATERQE